LLNINKSSIFSLKSETAALYVLMIKTILIIIICIEYFFFFVSYGPWRRVSGAYGKLSFQLAINK
jgi:hypothetical protein